MHDKQKNCELAKKEGEKSLNKVYTNKAENMYIYVHVHGFLLNSVQQKFKLLELWHTRHTC